MDTDWGPSDLELLERCIALHETGKTPNPGLLSRFYRTLAKLRGIEALPPDELRVVLAALALAGRENFDTTRRTEPILTALVEHVTIHTVRNASARALAAYWENHPPRDTSFARTLSTMEAFEARQRFFFAMLSGKTEDLERARSLVAEAELTVDELKRVHADLLSRPELGATELDLLEELYVNGSWLGRRILLKRLGPSHVELIPTLARVARRADPTTRRSVIKALRAMGHLSCEPILVALLDDVEPSVQSDVVLALGELGTRQSIYALSKHRDAPGDLGRDVSIALNRIEARYPVDARSGALSVADDGSLGALSLSGASEGEISLYRAVQRRMDAPEAATGALIERPSDELSSQPYWHRIKAGPRRLPAPFLAREVGLGSYGVSAIGWICLAITAAVFAHTGVPIPHTLFLALGAFIGGSSTYGRRRRAIANGTPAYAELVNMDVRQVRTNNGTRTEYDYTFDYMDEDEQEHSVTLSFNDRMPHIEDDPLEPILYTSDNDIVLFDEIQYLTVDENGELVSNDWVNALGYVMPIVFVLVTIGATLTSPFLGLFP